MIEKIAHVAAGLNESKSFYDSIINNVANFQNEGLEIEIQYGQSNNLFSALIIGRKPEKVNTTINMNITSLNNTDEITNEIVKWVQTYANSRI